MNYEQGLAILKQYAEGADWYLDFALYEAQLRERRYGYNSQVSTSRSEIVD